MNQNRTDTTCQVETPEGIDLEARLAGPVPRIIAYVIDFMIRSAILLAVSLLLMFLGKMGTGLILLLSFLFEWFYPVFFEVTRQGQTPGKRRMNLSVVNDDLTPVSWSASVTRNLLRAADFFPFAYLLGIVSMCVSKNFQRLGDMAAGTIVIHRPPAQDTAILPDCEPVMSPVSLSPEDQVALVSFVQRHNQLTRARQQELADILNDVMKKSPESSLANLQGIGVWLLGAR